jgi:predicted Rossmann fold flavoprotein
LKEDVKITAYDGDKPLKSASGEILFTDYGVSGNAVFQVSSSVAGVKNPYLLIEFLPELNQEEIADIIISRTKTGYIDKEMYLTGILNKRIGQAIIKSIDNVSPYSVANKLKNFRLKVVGDMGFNNSQVTRGGIETAFINPYSMESKLQKGFYIVGEALDVDGDCGGYNLTFAFVSGIISARSIKNKNN